ncbi:MAG: HAMP domain-containing histidine kinase, partial [Arcobacter sp.]|nr:HAMP domain-containing histidine kinase [Arcobacter sp.]
MIVSRSRKKTISQANLIFNVIAIGILLGSLVLYSLFETAKKNIDKTATNSQIEYIDDITNNISNLIINFTGENLHDTLKNKKELKQSLEKSLELLLTDRYKYVYVLDKEKNNTNEFRFLLDASKEKDGKSEFEEPYIPDNIDTWNNVYKTKKAVYVTHKGDKNLWITYLKPIVINNEVSAIIVIDFSPQTSEIIMSALNELDIFFEMALFFAILIFLIIVGFSYIDSKREEAKMTLFYRLEEANINLREQKRELEEKSEKIAEFNEMLTKRISEEVEKNQIQNQQLIQHSRLAQMGEMISMIAHQWRQPLNAISITTSNLQFKLMMDDVDNEFFTKEIQLIDDYSQHLSKTIDDFRDFLKEQKDKETTTLEQIVDATLNIARISAENKNIKISTNFNCYLEFETYPNELKQVVLNIIKNAEDILLEKNIEHPEIVLETLCLEDKTKQQLIIKDNGGGIPNEIIDKIFDPYFSTKLEKDGTGLGLYMSKTIIENHCGGKLTVSNNEYGAVFTIEFEVISNQIKQK